MATDVWAIISFLLAFLPFLTRVAAVTTLCLSYLVTQLLACNAIRTFQSSASLITICSRTLLIETMRARYTAAVRNLSVPNTAYSHHHTLARRCRQDSCTRLALCLYRAAGHRHDRDSNLC